jgi:hypothetical protein
MLLGVLKILYIYIYVCESCLTGQTGSGKTFTQFGAGQWLAKVTRQMFMYIYVYTFKLYSAALVLRIVLRAVKVLTHALS